ncbi:LamG-like jellyroll fold domain-containing protein [Flavobacterium algoritolerans]|uniref:Choice-of-anchor D domain-containing protein n=1 Tax=Flavobacterium algoritolerans TaxID=3041254 RepID=A0ABT6VEL2_9FLAO|nr:LamG-like jellyroll fold domain-containing protein [Flavobacterium algoritolerans]MDI5896240.1 choice-of-anchor D domain-containing protein [Flavobacterium algoritolerans]
MNKLLLKKVKNILIILFILNCSVIFSQQIDVYGNGNIINDNGGNSPLVLNQTNFGSTNESSGVITKVFTITNNALATNLTLGSITIAGANASDFTVTRQPATTVAPLGGTTTFEIIFNPTALGVRNATISFSTNVTGKNPYNFNLSGTGTSFPSQSYTLFYENFDANNGGWTAASSAGSSWTHGNTPYNGEGNYWRIGNNFGSNTASTLTSPTINTTGYNNIRISLDLRVGTQEADDGMQIQYSTDLGSTWKVLGAYQESTTWYNNSNVTTLNSGTGSLGSLLGFTGTINTGVAGFNDFVERSTQSNDLDNKSNIIFRILIRTNNTNNNGTIAIDNFFVKGDPITPFANKPFTPGNVPTNLKLWLKANAGTGSATDGTSLAQWNDQAIDNDAKSIGVAQPIYRDGTRNINYNPVVDFTIAGATSMRGKGGFHAQDYFVVVKSNNTINSASATRQAPISGRTSISSFHLDGTAFALGNFTARYKNELVSHSISSVPQTPSTSSYGMAYATTTETYIQETTIYNVKTNAAGTSTEIYKNGKRIDNYPGESVASDQITVTGILNFSEFNNIQYNLGVGRFSLNGNVASYLDGKLSEIISYSDIKSAAEKKKIESYLAIKNGVTLHASNSITANNLGDTDYVDSSGATIWSTSANTGFNYDIAGIGRDDNSALNQKQSKSENPGTVLTIGIGDVMSTNNLNPNSFLNDRNYLVWGSNDGTMSNSGVNLNIDLGPTTITTITEVVNRKWKVVETGGDVGTARVNIPTASFVSGLPALGATDAYVMVVATNAAFTTGLETVFMSTSGANETCLYDFDGTKYISFGVAHRATNPLHITLDGVDDYVRIDNSNELPTVFSVMTWIRPNGTNTAANERTILSKKSAAGNGYQIVLQNDNRVRFEWYDGSAILRTAITNTILPNVKWHNIAYTFATNTLSIYIDGVLEKTVTMSGNPGASTGIFSIGGQYITKNAINNLFKGDIDELRMWNRVLTATEIRFIMNQEIVQSSTGTTGTIIPSTITKNDINTLLWNNLFAYYSMNSYIGTHLDDDSVNVNRGSLVIPDKISINVQTAPMPYISTADGLWQTAATWTNGANQDQPYSLSIIDNATRVDWNIVRTTHTIISDGNKTVLGLFVNSNTLSATNDSKIEVSHYLKLDGKIDLVGRSQLVQKLGSDLDATSSGSLERDQQGQANKYNYNYWSSPVGAINTTTNNNTFTVAGVLRDGTNAAAPGTINWINGYDGATSPFSLARFWIYKFDNLANNYANWTQIGETGLLSASKGFTLKGPGTSGTQNLTFLGKPNNGTINNTVGADQLLLVGNPYPSALDANKFINDNIGSIETVTTNPAIDGALYFWEHYATNSSHELAAYQGGYGIRNLSGGVAPSATGVDFISGSGTASKLAPNQFIPVGQGFFIIGKVGTGGTVTFNNSQREFITETNASSQTTYKIPVNPKTDTHWTDNSNTPIEKDTHKKIRLGFNVMDKTFHRQVLLAFMDEKANSEMNDGYDAFNIDDSPSDMYLLNGENELAIQGEGYFDEDASFPIAVRTEAPGKVSFGIDALENFDQNQNIFIYDKETDTYNSIKNKLYEVELPQGYFTDRFSLRFTDKTLGVKDVIYENTIQVVFTRSNNVLNIKNGATDNTVVAVSLFNIQGKLMSTWDVSEKEQTNIKIPIQNKTSGVYIVKLKTSKGNINKKIIIK